MNSWKEKMDHADYTWRHKKAFLKVEKELLGLNTVPGYLHDMDKMIMYYLPFIKIESISKFHRKHSKHHFPRCLKSHRYKMQAIIDWECAKITKLDKQLDAVDTLFKYYPEGRESMYKEFMSLPFNDKFWKAKREYEKNRFKIV